MASFTHIIHCIDSHTAGEPTRLVTSGLPRIPGRTMEQKYNFARENLNSFRRMLLLEPRGHSDMFGAVLTPAGDPTCDYGLIFFDTGGWLTMCGHGTIGAAATLTRVGMVPTINPETIIKFDTPCGVVVAHVQTDEEENSDVWFENVPSFLYKRAQRLTVPELGELEVDISFGGNFFLIVQAAQVGIDIELSNSRRLVDVGMKILEAANSSFQVQHPHLPHINEIALVEFTQPAVMGADYRNVVVFGDGNFDRSPCGSGTCARMAELYSLGKLDVNQPFIHESIIGTRFEGRIIGETKVGRFPAVIPLVVGKAYLTGFQTFVLDPHDPLPEGFNTRA